MDKQLSFPKHKIQIALLEKIHDSARELLEDNGFTVRVIPKAMEGTELEELLKEVHVIGVRSRTKLRKENFPNAKKLLAVGCFSVGTDQVDLNAATSAAVPVFNAPHSSTRSVAELAIGNIIMLARQAATKSMKIHQGTWDKNISGAREIRGKTLGVVGYGHIGQQVGLLAEALGMEVIFYDILKKLPLGRMRPVGSLEELLKRSEFVSLHVPGSPQNVNLISEAELRLMPMGSFLVNLARGNIVDLSALREALQSGHLSGAALDVFPEEPTPPIAPFECPLSGLENVILTPHIGGNTEEAQKNIGLEVATALMNFIDKGSTEGAVNFPVVNLQQLPSTHRILNVHRNAPGALAELNQIISTVGANIEAQQLSTYRDIGYLVMDINRELSEEVREKIAALPISIRTRILY